MLNESAKKSKASRIWRVVGFFSSIVIIAAAVWVFNNRQLLADHLMVASFTPSQEIVTVTERSGFTETGKRIFYATRPEMSDSERFNTQCPRQEAGSPILGCYTTNDRIYIYSITNPRLDGMEEVTAVHEMLHAVWQRASQSERDALEKLLNAEYLTTTDEALKARMEYYKRTEPDQLVNELHSIIGTEAKEVSDELAAYYEKYFDRAAVLAHHANYSTVYTSLYDRSEELYASMQSLSASIEARSSEYAQAIAQLESEITAFNTRANAGSFSSASQFQVERSALVGRSDALEANRQAINADIARYDTYYEEYQTIASEIQVLNDSTDSFHELKEAPSI